MQADYSITSMGSITLTPGQFEALLASLGAQQAATVEALLARGGSQPDVVRTTISGPIGWADLPTLDPNDPAGIDRWFLAFETKLKAARLDQSRWAERFEECPRVPQHLKSRLPADALTDYVMTRRWVLREHGPLDPVGYFRAKIYGVKGDARDQVRKELEEYLVLYNRAAADCEGSPWSKRDLLYPFIHAFGEEVSQALARDLGFALGHDDPFEQLYIRAPDAPSGRTLLHRIQEAEGGHRRKRLRTPDERKRGACQGCGGSCRDRRTCPAQGKACHNCQSMHHFAAVCRKPSREDRFGGAERTNPFRLGQTAPPPR